ncbi:MAG: hypothetical protein P8X90_36845 [Desulfobacterales bacterium]
MSVLIDMPMKHLAGPLHEKKGILYAEIDLSIVAPAKRTLDVVGHYAMPDIFTLHINNQPQSPVKSN